jgi:hypothetical protein
MTAESAVSAALVRCRPHADDRDSKQAAAATRLTTDGALSETLISPIYTNRLMARIREDSWNSCLYPPSPKPSYGVAGGCFSSQSFWENGIAAQLHTF